MHFCPYFFQTCSWFQSLLFLLFPSIPFFVFLPWFQFSVRSGGRQRPPYRQVLPRSASLITNSRGSKFIQWSPVYHNDTPRQRRSVSRAGRVWQDVKPAINELSQHFTPTNKRLWLLPACLQPQLGDSQRAQPSANIFLWIVEYHNHICLGFSSCSQALKIWHFWSLDRFKQFGVCEDVCGWRCFSSCWLSSTCYKNWINTSILF